MATATARNQYLDLAKLAKEVGRYEDMMEYMEKIALSAVHTGLTVEERELLSEACERVTGSLQTILVSISSIEKKEMELGDTNHVAYIRIYRKHIHSKLSSICKGIFHLIGNILIPVTNENESKVFYLMMKADCYCQLAECLVGSERKDAADDALSCYEAAQDIAREKLGRHPIRITLALKFSTFYFEVLCRRDKACTVAQQAYEDAVTDIATQLSTIQLLRDKINSWKS